MSKGNG
ncbi:choline-phosphate cytidylyltransferase [Schistosoma mansoni]|nr:choline-phosphate cytidylyltransferase [Schistosoma mansoni]|eukprot:XP_018647373.1 choline-phosphate cytidylyltransferase [Schistosoma mansoni]